MWLAVALGALWVLVFAAWLLGVWGGAYATRVIDDFGLLGSAVFAAAWCVLAARRGTGRRRASWIAMAAGLGAWSLGEAVWCYYELWQHAPQTPFPSLADAGFLMFPVGAAVALVLFPGGRGGQSRTSLLDGIIVAASMFVVSWVTVLGSVYKAGAASHFALVVSLAYPVSDLVLVTMTILVWTRALNAQRLTVALVTIGIGLMALSDSLFAYLTATDAYHTGSLIDVGWLAAFVLFGLAASSSTTSEPEVAALAVQTSNTRLWLPYVPLVLAGVVSVPRSLPSLASGPVPSVTLAAVIAVLIRQFVTVAENRRLLVTVGDMALHDPLTGLANRALFTDRLNHALSLHRRNLRELAVLWIDLDDFKSVNDSLGHAAGDDLLVRVAERLIGCLRGGDTVARMGGDEFAVLIEDSSDHPLLVANWVAKSFRLPFIIDGHSLAVQLSIGVACASADSAEVSAATLLRQADVAMYTAKREGGARAYLFRPEIQPADVGVLRLRHDPTKGAAVEEAGLAPSGPPSTTPTDATHGLLTPQTRGR
jgi:diguanylate cyclase